MLARTLAPDYFFSFLPSFKPLLIFPPEFILQLLRDLCSHIARLPLCLLSPVSQSTQECPGHLDTISMPLVSCLGGGVITIFSITSTNALALEIET